MLRECSRFKIRLLQKFYDFDEAILEKFHSCHSGDCEYCRRGTELSFANICGLRRFRVDDRDADATDLGTSGTHVDGGCCARDGDNQQHF